MRDVGLSNPKSAVSASSFPLLGRRPGDRYVASVCLQLRAFAGLNTFIMDPHNIIEFLATILSLGSNILAVCNDKDWPVHVEGADGVMKCSETGFLCDYGTVWSFCPENDVAPLAAQEFLAFSIFFRWLNLVPRIMQRSLMFGPLILVCRLMVADMLKWLFLASWMNVAFGSFFVALYTEPVCGLLLAMFLISC